MGLTFSRSVRFGPVRLNFTGSGIGVSTGIRGLRIGSGPRGAYINAGMGGFRYRASLGASRHRPSINVPADRPVRAKSLDDDAGVLHTEESAGANMLALSDASDDDLLRSMNEQAKRLSLWPWVAATLLAVLWYIFIHIPNMPDVMSVLLVASSIAATCLVYFRDKWKRLTVLFYEPDEAIMARFQRLLAGAAKAAAIRKVQAINARAMYANSKYHFGAKTGVKFSRGSLRIGQGPGVVANTEVPIVESGSIILAFYPDRVLVFSRRSVGAIEYQDIEAKSLVSKFVETERVPGDATVIGHQWRYANKQGGPDRRFKANRQFPLCQYNELVLASPRGLDIHLHGSKSDGFDDFVDALKALASSPAAASPKATHRGSVN